MQEYHLTPKSVDFVIEWLRSNELFLSFFLRFEKLQILHGTPSIQIDLTPLDVEVFPISSIKPMCKINNNHDWNT